MLIKSYEELAKLTKEVGGPILVITDWDPDGTSAGALMKVILKKLNKNFDIILRPNRGLSKETLEKIIKKNSNYQAYIFLDSPFKDEYLLEISSKYNNKIIIYIDHHKREIPKEIPKNLFYFDARALRFEPVPATAEIIYKIGKILFNEEFRKYSLLAFLGAWGDWMIHPNSEIIEDLKKQYNLILESDLPVPSLAVLFTLYLFTDAEKRLKFGEKIVENIISYFKSVKSKGIESEFNEFITRLVKLKTLSENERTIVYFTKEKASMLATFLSAFCQKDILAIVAPNREEGNIRKVLHLYRTLKVSLRRCRESQIDVGKIAKDFTDKFGIHGGGHPEAAGMLIKKKDLQNFIEFLRRILNKQ